MDIIEEKVKLWIFLWEDLIETLLEDSSFELQLYSPHILINDIIIEIEENAFGNSDNKNFFNKKLCDYLKNDLLVKANLETEFNILKAEINSKKIAYVLSLCKEIQKSFSEGLFFDTSLNEIINILTSNNAISAQLIHELNSVNKGIILELILKGYHIKDIKQLLLKIFDKYKLYDTAYGESISTSFPHEIKQEDYTNANGEFNRAEYNKAVINLIDNLSWQDRMKRLSYYFYKKTQKVKYVFYVEGLIGDISIDIGEVTLYSLNNKGFIDKKYFKDGYKEDLQNFETDQRFIQAAVEVDLLTPQSTFYEAVAKLEKALNFLSFEFNTKIQINQSIYFVVNQEGNPIAQSWSLDPNRDIIYKFHKARNITKLIDYDYKKFSYLWVDSKAENKTPLKIINALHWLRKGDNSTKYEDQILNYWIALENLIDSSLAAHILGDSGRKKIDVIKEIIASSEIIDFIYHVGWKLRSHYFVKANPSFNESIFPEELKEKAQLKYGRVELKNFIDNIDEIRSYEEDFYYLHKLDEAKVFFNDSKITLQKLNAQIEQIKDDILIIYRFRNLIVHNANFDNKILPFYIMKIKGFCQRLVKHLVIDFSEEKNLSEMLLKIYLRGEKLKENLKKGKNIYDIKV